MNNKVFELEETKNAWDSDYYHSIAQQYYDSAIRTMLRLMEVEPGATVLDAGCGSGMHSIRVAQNGHRVCAIDISKTMLQEAKARLESASMSQVVEFRKEDLTNLSFQDASFRYVFSWGVIIHIREIERALDELSRIVVPGGMLALYVTNKTAWDYKIESVVRFLSRKPLSKLEGLLMGDGVSYNMHNEKLWVWRIEAAALTKYIEAHGFRRTHQVTGEFTEIQRRFGGVLRKLLLQFNNLYYQLKLPPSPAATNLFIFKKIG